MSEFASPLCPRPSPGIWNAVGADERNASGLCVSVGDECCDMLCAWCGRSDAGVGARWLLVPLAPEELVLPCFPDSTDDEVLRFAPRYPSPVPALALAPVIVTLRELWDRLCAWRDGPRVISDTLVEVAAAARWLWRKACSRARRRSYLLRRRRYMARRRRSRPMIVPKVIASASAVTFRFVPVAAALDDNVLLEADKLEGNTMELLQERQKIGEERRMISCMTYVVCHGGVTVFPA